MTYWTNLQDAAGMGGSLHWVAPLVIISAFALGALAPEARRRIVGSLLIFLLSLAALLAAAAIHTWTGTPASDAYRWVRNPAVILMAIAIINLAGVLVFRVLLRAVHLEPPPILRDLIQAIAYIVAILSLLSQMQVNLTGIVATSAVVTAVIGFSLQDTLGNIMGGMALQMEQSISVGDWVRIGDQEGVVKEIRWRQTSIETRNWDTIIIPNSALMKSQVIVLGRRTGQPRQRREQVMFYVDYRHSPTAVIAAAEAAVRQEPVPNIASTPQPNCVLLDFRDSYGAYSMRYWLIDLGPNDAAASHVRSRIYAALRRAGMSLSIPAQTVFVTQEDEPRRQRKLDEETHRRIAALGGVELLHPLTDDERHELARRLQVAPFIRGEALTRQGAEAHHLFIMTRGSAEVRVAVDGNGASQRVATLKDGDFFGEMGLMTGAPRSATIIALSDCTCYRLDKEAFIGILQRRPEIAESISHILARRRAELDAVREGLNEEALRQRVRSTEGDLLRRIRKFFTLAN